MPSPKYTRRFAEIHKLDMFKEEAVSLREYYSDFNSLGYDFYYRDMRTLFCLCNELASLNKRDVIVMDVGTFVGTSAVCLSICDDVDKVITVDDWLGKGDQGPVVTRAYEEHDVPGIFLSNTNGLSTIRGMSCSASQAFKKTPSRLDMVFLDASRVPEEFDAEIRGAIGILGQHRQAGEAAVICGTGYMDPRRQSVVQSCGMHEYYGDIWWAFAIAEQATKANTNLVWSCPNIGADAANPLLWAYHGTNLREKLIALGGIDVRSSEGAVPGIPQ